METDTLGMELVREQLPQRVRTSSSGQVVGRRRDIRFK